MNIKKIKDRIERLADEGYLYPTINWVTQDELIQLVKIAEIAEEIINRYRLEENPYDLDAYSQLDKLLSLIPRIDFSDASAWEKYIDEGLNYVATDFDGDVYGYIDKPILDEYKECWRPPNKDSYCVAIISNDAPYESWRESLIKRPE